MKRIFIIPFLTCLLLVAPAAEAMNAFKNFGARFTQAARIFNRNNNDYTAKAMKLGVVGAGIASVGMVGKERFTQYKNSAEYENHFNCKQCYPIEEREYLKNAQGKNEEECIQVVNSIKTTMGLNNKIIPQFGINLFGLETFNAMAGPEINRCNQHGPFNPLLIMNHSKNNSKQNMEFILAHELGHISKNHDTSWKGDIEFSSYTAQRRTDEYEADKIAALTLESIDGGMKLFGATQDSSNTTGWKLPEDNYYGKDEHGNPLILDESEQSHPSHANRCRALLALLEKYPDKFQKKIYFVNTVNNCAT